jgi:hypothetical protein
MEELTSVSGSIIRCTEKVSLLGQTEELTKEATKTIKRTAMEYSHGKFTKQIMVSNLKIGQIM